MGRYNFIKTIGILVASAVTFVATSFAQAQSNSGITYHGRILKPDGTPLNGTAVQFKMQIRSPGNENCLLYEEVQTKNLSGSNGAFSITINDGSGPRGADFYSPGLRYTLDQVFQNRTPFATAATCESGGSYNPNYADGRRFTVLFKDENMADWEEAPQAQINFVPFALDSKTVAGFGPRNLLRVDDAAMSANATPFTLTQFNSLVALIGGTSTLYTKQSATGGVALPSYTTAAPPSGAAAGSIWYDSTDGKLKYHNGSGAVTLDTGSSSTLPAVGTAGTYTKVTTDAQGRVTTGTTLAESDIPQLTAANKVTGSAITTGNISTTGSFTSTSSVTGSYLSGRAVHINEFSNTNAHYVQLRTPDASDGFASSYVLTLPLNDGAANELLMTDGAGKLSWTSGTGLGAWSVSGADVFRMNGNVGIGTNTPTSKLHVTSDLTATTGEPKLNYYYGIANPTAASTATYYGTAGSVAKFNNANLSGATITGVTGVAEQGGTGVLGGATGVEAMVTKYGAGDISTATGVYSHFQSSSAGTTSNFLGLLIETGVTTGALTNAYGVRIRDLQGATSWGVYQEGANDTNYFAGSVGVGTNDPKALLDVRGTLGAGPAPTNTNNPNMVINARSYGNPHIILEKTTANTGGIALDSSNMVFGSENAGFTFRTGVDYEGDFTTTGTERVRISDNGNFGIGIIAPARILHVSGPIRIEPAALPTTPANGDIAIDSADGNKLKWYNGSWQTVGSGSGSTTLSGDVSGSSSATSVDKIKGVAVTLTSPADGQYLKYNSGAWINSAIAMGDVTGLVTAMADKVAYANFPSTCTAAQTIVFTSPANTFTCLNISLPTSQITGQLAVANGGTGVATAAQNSVFAGPSTGGAGAPSFRALTASDLPSGVMTGASGTAGYIPYFATSTSIGNSVLYTDGTNIGLGTTSPGEKLHVNGNVLADSYIQTSDRRLKTNVQSIDGLELIKRLRGVKYERLATGKTEIGLIAQEVEAVIPELVFTNPETGIKGVQYQNLVAPLIEAVKESESENAELRKKVDRLEDALAEQQMQIKEMQSIMRKLATE